MVELLDMEVAQVVGAGGIMVEGLGNDTAPASTVINGFCI